MKKILSIILCSIFLFSGILSVAAANIEKAQIRKNLIVSKTYILKNYSDGESIIETTEKQVQSMSRSEMTTMIEDFKISGTNNLSQKQEKILSYMLFRMQYALVDTSGSSIVIPHTNTGNISYPSKPLVYKTYPKEKSHSSLSGATYYAVTPPIFTKKMESYSPDTRYAEVMIIQNGLNDEKTNKMLSFLLSQKIISKNNIMRAGIGDDGIIDFINTHHVHSDFPIFVLFNYENKEFSDALDPFLIPYENDKAILRTNFR